MWNIGRSEFRKLKNTGTFFLCLGAVLFSVLLGFLLYHVAGNTDVSTRTEIFISVFFLQQILLSVLLAHLSFRQEKRCGEFQNIFLFPKVWQVWINKIGVLVFLQILTAAFSLLMADTFCGRMLPLRSLFPASAIHIAVSLNLHMLFLVFFGEIGNLLAGILEAILLVFSTNIPMERLWHWFPCTYGYKITEFFDTIPSGQWTFVTGVFFLSVLLNGISIQHLRK